MRKVWYLGILLTLTLIGCQMAPIHEENIIEEEPIPLIEESIYNRAYEPYNQLTDLGVILNTPTEKDLEGFIQLDTYISNNKDISQNILIIPKYNGTKITINRVEYTGERYISKEELMNVESTPSHYGLLIGKECLSGHTQLGMYMTYNGNNVEYIFDTKTTSNERDYLKVEVEVPIEGEPLAPITDVNTYLQGLECLAKSEVDLDQDGLVEVVEVYKDSKTVASGEWALILCKDNKVYPLFERNYIERGGLGYTLYEDYDTHETHIMIGYSTDQAIIYYDCIWDELHNILVRHTLYEVGHMKRMSEWWYKIVLET